MPDTPTATDSTTAPTTLHYCPLTDLPGSTLASNTTIGPAVTLDFVPAYWGQSSTAGGSNQIDVTVELSDTIQALMQRTWDSHLIGVGKDGNGMTHRRTQVRMCVGAVFCIRFFPRAFLTHNM